MLGDDTAPHARAAPGRPRYTGYDLRQEYAKSPEARQVLAALRAKQLIEDRAAEKLRVLADLFRLHPDQRVLVFTGSNAMAREVSVRFLIPCLLHHCRKNERRQVLEGFRDGRFRAIVANQVLDEGVDLPEAKIAVVLGGLTSAKQAKQRLGRILRSAARNRPSFTKWSAAKPKRRPGPAGAGTAMLTKELAIFELDRDRLVPERLTRHRHRHYLGYAREMLSIYEKGLGCTRRNCTPASRACFAANRIVRRSESRPSANCSMKTGWPSTRRTAVAGPPPCA